ncbi:MULTISPECIES: hypothetical protein [Gilliamella]|uniref:SMI1 / KNR4 family (SUKH-1) n=1 Tax=Gilliamella intestini TaxID=1798183 RepID=A0A1C4D1X5_9GAMM|nr:MULTISPECIES: hypothetical protein [Gilliamella]MCO6538486.1 hypothetical protein [Gilliamella sp.]SCC25372.1 hypothetical protein GA0061080_105625 [Gilliamella intestini]
MSNIFLYNLPILPNGFAFPKSYVDTVKNNNIIQIEPWSFLCQDIGMSLSYYGSMLIKYTNHPLIPFAIANDQSGFFNDGYIILACFDGNDTSGDPKVYFHDYGYSGEEPSWENRYHLDNFLTWFELVKAESAQYKAERSKLDLVKY